MKDQDAVPTKIYEPGWLLFQHLIFREGSPRDKNLKDGSLGVGAGQHAGFWDSYRDFLQYTLV
jgi:hypothetical protein